MTSKEGTKEYPTVLTWNETFAASEVRKVLVKYTMRLSVVSANSAQRDFDAKGRIFMNLDRAFTGVTMVFPYITSTATTWKPPVEEALFELHGAAVDRALRTGPYEGAEPWRARSVVLLDYLTPPDARREGDVVRWRYAGSVPKEGVAAGFTVLMIPSDEAHVAGFVRGAAAAVERPESEVAAALKNGPGSN